MLSPKREIDSEAELGSCRRKLPRKETLFQIPRRENEI
jgi:hypothetical protein